MAFETSTLVNGEWTTRTLDVNTVLRHYDQQDEEANARLLEVDKPPVLGLLTQTIIRSPVVHWILPVRLRSNHSNDVAFIGDGFIQIKELRPDGHLCDVIRKDDFGTRIRNACVVGSMKAYAEDRTEQATSEQIKDEDDDVDMDAFTDSRRKAPGETPPLPPQFILIQLDTGDSLFLALHQSESGQMKFFTSRHRVSKSMLSLQPGKHLAVDPSSRYMAVGCSEGLFAIYSLHSRQELQKQYSQQKSIRHVESERYMYFNGVIHKLEFLYPSADDESHVILLALVIIKGKTRMVLYEWETGKNLRDVRANSQRGHLLEESRQMPLLLIPLTIKSSFILVSEKCMTLCQDIIQGTPKCTDFNTRLDPPTFLHHGSGIPLWTAWARPIRLPYHTANRDDIYIAREDGLVKFLEIDSEEFVSADMNIGHLGCNCGTALASLDYQQQNNSGNTGDLLITGGDSSAGGTVLLFLWSLQLPPFNFPECHSVATRLTNLAISKVKARQPLEFIETLQNWSPAQDFVTSSRAKDGRPLDEYVVSRASGETIPKPDRIFACVGKGTKGTITEFRYGLEGNLGLEMEYDTQIMRAWVSSIPDPLHQAHGFLFLLSLGDRSALLQLSSDATEIVELDQNSTPLDLRYRTITASLRGSCKIQVTEQSVVVWNNSDFYIYEGERLLAVQQGASFIGSGSVIDEAVIYHDVVLFTTHLGHETYLQVLEIESSKVVEDLEYSPVLANGRLRTLASFASHVTCLAMSLVGQTLCAIIAEWSGDSISLTLQPTIGGLSHVLTLPARYGDNRGSVEAVVSLVLSSNVPGYLTLLCGTRNGLVITLEIVEDSLKVWRSRCDRFGATPAIITRDEYSDSGEQFFVSCDSKVHRLSTELPTSGPDGAPLRGNRRIHQIWLTDALNPTLQQPSVNSVARLQPNDSGGTDGGLLLIAGTQLLLAGLSTRPKIVPRHLPIGGTPSRLLFSHALGVLVVAASVNGKSTLLFIDPDTGADLSKPVDKKMTEVEYASGLGNANERAFCLLEWPYTKDGKTWQFIIVCTSSGRLLIISTEKEDQPSILGPDLHSDAVEGEYGGNPDGNSATLHKIRYWTRHKFKCTEAVYSVVGFADGLFYCSGETLYCETLDLAEKRFKRVAEYKLPSPALSLTHANGSIYALTSSHSLEILQLVPDGNGISQIVRTHSAQMARHGLHHKIVPGFLEYPINFISDKMCSVAGLWASKNTKVDTLETVFETQLPHSIIRFRSATCRPIWDSVWTTLDVNSGKDKMADEPMNIDVPPCFSNQPETLGLAIDGSLSHFTVLTFNAWHFLRFLINLAMQSPTVCEFTYVQDAFPLVPVLEPKTMLHIDGDILKRCLENRSLEELLRIGEETKEASRIYTKFCELLQELHRGSLERNASPSVYVQQAYVDLEIYLRPVL